MASLLWCGPKLAACGLVLSIWGVVMLVLLGIFFNVHSAILLEDVPFQEKDIDDDNLEAVHKAYEQVSYSCFLTAGMYVLLGLLSACQARLNRRKQMLGQ
uniref:ribonuclease kappa n=1 Tax=Myxine glutinosa TaxID=7769 RepID=UPI00358FB657